MSDGVTFSEFARLQGWSPSYVTKLRQAGRLVLTENGKRVFVEKSLARIEETRDPNRDDVAARHAETRATPARSHDPGPVGDPLPPSTKDTQSQAGQSFAASRAVKERFLALGAKLEYERAVGKVVETAAVRAAGTEAGTVLRAALENLPDHLAPELAEGDPEREQRIRARLAGHVEQVLTEISDKLKALSEQVAEAQA